MATTAIHRRVNPKLWMSSDFHALSAPPPNAQTLWLYLLTCGKATRMPGVLVDAGAASIAEDIDPLGESWTSKDVARLIRDELEPKGMVRWDPIAKLMWLPNAVHHRELAPRNPSVVTGWRNQWEVIAACPLKSEIWFALNNLSESLGDTYSQAFAEACPHQERTIMPDIMPPMMPDTKAGIIRDNPNPSPSPSPNSTPSPISPLKPPQGGVDHYAEQAPSAAQPASEPLALLPPGSAHPPRKGRPPTKKADRAAWFAREAVRAGLGDDVETVVSIYVAEHKRVMPRSRPSPGVLERGLVAERLMADGCTLTDLREAIEGCLSSEFHVKHGHTSLELIVRDRGRVEDFRRKREAAQCRPSTPTVRLDPVRMTYGDQLKARNEAIRRANMQRETQTRGVNDEGIVIDLPPEAPLLPPSDGRAA